MRKAILLLVAFIVAGCSSARPVQPTLQAQQVTESVGLAAITRSDHVFVLVEENHGYVSVIGSSSMPYLNSLANKYGLATSYYANTHPSIGNYFMMTAGQLITNNDSYTGTVSADNIVRHLAWLGKTWKVYAEDLPGIGYLGGNTANYVKRHNPFAYFTDVRNSRLAFINIVPFTQLATDTAAGKLPNFSFIVPNQIHNGHSASLANADAWLKAKIAPLLASKYFQPGGDGVLYLTFDESDNADTNHGGGRVATLVISPLIKAPGYRSTTLYQHQSLLRTVLSLLGDVSFPAAANVAPSMAEFLNTPPPPGPGYVMVTPIDGSTHASPVLVEVSDSNAVQMAIWIDFKPVLTVPSNSIKQSIQIPDGVHRFVVVSIDGTGKATNHVETITVDSHLRPVNPAP